MRKSAKGLACARRTTTTSLYACTAASVAANP
eukprot:CAMPEP_0180185030 /NCGR_PEP_ID=MMETSP0986-20121125/42167_1 /TAXON_ID=697907 /ORGANISM="non described non described, Strain CCMP2293" /LENGTH=31 /DNA_ID= /DNA_START= /DNA_END= /DNA_ORIENTATION=